MSTEQEKQLALLQETEGLEWFEIEIDSDTSYIIQGRDEELTEEWRETESEKSYEEWLMTEKEDLILEVEDYNENDSDWLVCTDSEADEAWDRDLDNFIDECVLPEIPEAYRNYFDDKGYKKDCKVDGRGHSLARYDGHECEQEVNGTTYYLYRQN